MTINDANPFLRACEIQQSVLQGKILRRAYDYRLFYVINGEGLIVTDKVSEQLSANTLIIFDDSVCYKFVGNLKVLVVNFDVSQKNNKVSKPKVPNDLPFYREDLRFNPDKLDEIKPFNIYRDAESVLPTLYEMLGEFNSINPYRKAMCSTLLKSTIITLLTISSLGTDAETMLVNKVNAIVKTDISKVESISAVANDLGYHPVYLSTVYKNKTGNNLSTIIMEERIKLACKYLLVTDENIENISIICGFSSRSHFCTAFKKAKGVSPLTYRKRATKNQ